MGPMRRGPTVPIVFCPLTVRGGFRVRVGVGGGFRVRVRDRVSVRAKGWPGFMYYDLKLWRRIRTKIKSRRIPFKISNMPSPHSVHHF